LSDFRRFGPSVFNQSHSCDKEALENRKRCTEKGLCIDIITKWNDLRILSIQHLAYVVHQWFGPGKDPYLYAAEEPHFKSWIENSLTTNLGKIQSNHWAYRALNVKENKRTVINNSELLSFLNLAKATFASFQAEIDGKGRYFYLYIPAMENQEWLLK
jgi:hypothetical protein